MCCYLATNLNLAASQIDTEGGRQIPTKLYNAQTKDSSILAIFDQID